MLGWFSDDFRMILQYGRKWVMYAFYMLCRMLHWFSIIAGWFSDRLSGSSRYVLNNFKSNYNSLIGPIGTEWLGTSDRHRSHPAPAESALVGFALAYRIYVHMNMSMTLACDPKQLLYFKGPKSLICHSFFKQKWPDTSLFIHFCTILEIGSPKSFIFEQKMARIPPAQKRVTSMPPP